jgi:amino acid transporter
MTPHRDIEMNIIKMKEDSLAQGSSYSMREPVYDEVPKQSLVERFRSSFKRDPSRRITPKDPAEEADAQLEAADAHDSHYYDIHRATLQTAHSGLARKLKGRHLQMIAIGGSIGTLAPYNCLGRHYSSTFPPCSFCLWLTFGQAPGFLSHPGKP